MNSQRITRNYHTRYALVATLAIVSIIGCSRMRLVVPQPPPISDLYQQAVDKATQYPEATITPHESLPPIIDAADATRGPTSGSVRKRFDQDNQAAAEPLPPGAAPAEEEKLLTMVFADQDIRQAVQELANEAGGVSVVIDDKIRGIVATEITDLTFDEALRKILLPLGLVYAKQGKHYLITSTDPESPMFAQVAERSEYRPLHHSANELNGMLNVKHQKYVRVLEKRNVISIEAPHMLNEQIRSRLMELDQPVSQVVLEAIVCVVAPNSNFRFGVDWNQKLAASSSDVFDLGMTGLALTGKFSPQGARNAFDDFAVTSAFVNLLAQNGYLTIRASPRVMAKDGEKAQISISRESYFSTQPITSSAAQSTSLVFAQNIQKVDSGITLNITPSIRGDSVTCFIEKAEVSEDIRTAESLSNPYPVINRRQVSTTVHVKDGKTIVIGGLVQRQLVDRVNQVPYLSGIPLIGKAFQNIEKQEQEAEVVIFISPRIVNQDPECRIVDGHESMRR